MTNEANNRAEAHVADTLNDVGSLMIGEGAKLLVQAHGRVEAAKLILAMVTAIAEHADEVE